MKEKNKRYPFVLAFLIEFLEQYQPKVIANKLINWIQLIEIKYLTILIEQF